MTATNPANSADGATDSWPIGPDPGGTGRARRTHRRLQHAIREMDLHLSRCAECLTFGAHLCYEGRFAFDEVDLTRSAMLRYELKVPLVPSAVGPSGPFLWRPDPT